MPTITPRCPIKAASIPILTFAPSDMPGTLVRMRPFMGQLGTCPSMAMPDSHNAGDFGAFLVGAPHAYAITAEELAEHKTDGHMDIDAVRAGAILVAPVKVRGAGIYMGDMHAAQGDGEIAGHTMDVAGSVTLQVEVVKDYPIDGPVLFPLDRGSAAPGQALHGGSEIAKGQSAGREMGRDGDRAAGTHLGDRDGGQPQCRDRQWAGARRHSFWA